MDGQDKGQIQEGNEQESATGMIEDLQFLTLCHESFIDFFNLMFSRSIDKFRESEHFSVWSKMLQHDDNTCILAPRKHAKSSLLYAYLMWKILRNRGEKRDLEILYISFKEELASWHIKQMKTYLKRNPYFEELKNLTPAEGVGKFTWDNEFNISIDPAGILSFVRGRRADIVILDDVLADPTTMLDLSVIRKVNQRVFEDVMAIPKEGGETKVIGTAQTYEDFFFKLKNNPAFAWGMFPAILNEKEKKVLWETLFSYERLMQIKSEIGNKAFSKEYMIAPVYSEESYFTKEQIMRIVKKDLISKHFLDTDDKVIAGWDIGKHSHPSHFSVFQFVPDENKENPNRDIARMIYHRFFDNVDYKDQLRVIQGVVDSLKIDRVKFDNTRGELEGFYEQGMMDNSVFVPVTFTTKTKNAMASEFEKRVNFQPYPTVEIINSQRMINLILTVTNDLEAVETSEGHGDSFWSIALALSPEKEEKFEVIEKMGEVFF